MKDTINNPETDNEVTDYHVHFVGTHFTMTVRASDVHGGEEEAIDVAAALIEDYYGWDVMAQSKVAIEVEPF